MFPATWTSFILLLLLLNSPVLLLILTSALKNILLPSSNHAITSSGQFGTSVRYSPSTQLLPLHAVSFSPAWITAIPFSKVHLPPWFIPCNAHRTNMLILFFLNPTLLTLNAWRNCTGYRSIIASSSKLPSWHIELSRHPIHPFSTTSFSAAMHLVFVHLPLLNYQFTNLIPHQQRLLICLSCCLECITSSSKRSTIPGALQMSPEDPPLQVTNMKPMKTQGASDTMEMAHYKLTITYY